MSTTTRITINMQTISRTRTRTRIRIRIGRTIIITTKTMDRIGTNRNSLKSTIPKKKEELFYWNFEIK